MKTKVKKIGHLKKFFVPHKHNDYHPHLFRNTFVLTTFFVCAFLLGVSYHNYILLNKTVLGANIATNVLVDLANKNRVGNNVAPLTRNTKLDNAASMKATDMINKNYFAHFAPDGTSPWYFIQEAGYNFSYAGENLAIDFTSENDIDNAWMNSPLHKENLLNSNFKELGLAAKEGVRNGVDTVYVVQMFGSRLTPSPSPTERGEVQVVSKVPKKVTVIQESKNVIVVKNLEVKEDSNLAVNTEVEKEGGKVAGVETYASWYDKYVFDSPYYIQLFFIVLIIIIMFGIGLRLIIEYKRQHWKHFVISLAFLFAIMFLALLNLNFINF